MNMFSILIPKFIAHWWVLPILWGDGVLPRTAKRKLIEEVIPYVCVLSLPFPFLDNLPMSVERSETRFRYRFQACTWPSPLSLSSIVFRTRRISVRFVCCLWWFFCCHLTHIRHTLARRHAVSFASCHNQIRETYSWGVCVIVPEDRRNEKKSLPITTMHK